MWIFINSVYIIFFSFIKIYATCFTQREQAIIPTIFVVLTRNFYKANSPEKIQKQKKGEKII